MALVDWVCEDIRNFLQLSQEIFFNELDFQVHLATSLRASQHYDDVDVEYYIPYQTLKKYEWKNEVYIDIVVSKNREFVPIELKHKTSKVNKLFRRFNEEITIDVLKNQAAQNLGKYAFWKDVRRIELVRNRFDAVKNGVAVFLTNDKSYYDKSKKGNAESIRFSMAEGVHSPDKSWLDSSKLKDNYPSFEVEKEYTIHWNSLSIMGEMFKYCIVVI